MLNDGPQKIRYYLSRIFSHSVELISRHSAQPIEHPIGFEESMQIGNSIRVIFWNTEAPYRSVIVGFIRNDGRQILGLLCR